MIKEESENKTYGEKAGMRCTLKNQKTPSCEGVFVVLCTHLQIDPAVERPAAVGVFKDGNGAVFAADARSR